MHFNSLLKFLALAATASLVAASPTKPVPGRKLKITTNDLPADAISSTTTKCATLSQGQSINDTSIVWEDCPTVVARHEQLEADYNRNKKRGIVCKKRNGCEAPCYVNNAETIQLTGHGTWETGYCHMGGLRTQNVGSFAWVSTGHSTSTTWSGSVSLAGPVSKFLDATFGFETTKSKSINQGLGCVNNDGQPHSVWLNERMGWSDSLVTDVTTFTGLGCEQHGSVTNYHTVHADFPDPYKSGYRDLLAGCTSPDDGQGPWCDLDAPMLNRN